jgi:hypothetical protein
MSIVPDRDGHVRLALGLYFLGGLDAAQEATVERHLARRAARQAAPSPGSHTDRAAPRSPTRPAGASDGLPSPAVARHPSWFTPSSSSAARSARTA